MGNGFTCYIGLKLSFTIWDQKTLLWLKHWSWALIVLYPWCMILSAFKWCKYYLSLLWKEWHILKSWHTEGKAWEHLWINITIWCHPLSQAHSLRLLQHQFTCSLMDILNDLFGIVHLYFEVFLIGTLESHCCDVPCVQCYYHLINNTK